VDLALGCFVDRKRIVAGTSGRWVRLRHHHVDGSAYGGLMGNARGLVRFGEAVLGRREGLDVAVRADLLRTVSGPAPSRSLGWFRGSLSNEPWLAHAGGGLGAYGELRLYPESLTVSALLTNRPGLRDEKLLDRVDRLWANPERPHH
jgi:CubicO group peptidase (beta-lactamase class C family)